MPGNVFLAVDFADDTRHALAATLSESGAAVRIPGRRTRPANWHITLRFVGEATEVQTDRLAGRTDSLLRLSAPGRGTVTAEGLDAFPRLAKATVLFASIADRSGLLSALAGICDEAATDVGFEPEGRPFVPHLTLSRIRPPRDVRSLVGRLELAPVKIEVTAVTMFQTTETPNGITYVPLHVYEL